MLARSVDSLADQTDPRCYVPLATDERVLGVLLASLERRASPLLLVGGSGIGKTVLLREIAQRERGRRVLFSPFLHLPPEGAAEWLLHLLGTPRSAAASAEEELLRAVGSPGVPPLDLLVDEVQRTPPESARLLCRLARAGAPRLAVLAAGTRGPLLDALVPELDPKQTVLLPDALPQNEMDAFCEALLERPDVSGELRRLATLEHDTIVDRSAGLPALLKAELVVRASKLAAKRSEREAWRAVAVAPLALASEAEEEPSADVLLEAPSALGASASRRGISRAGSRVRRLAAAWSRSARGRAKGAVGAIVRGLAVLGASVAQAALRMRARLRATVARETPRMRAASEQTLRAASTLRVTLEAAIRRRLSGMRAAAESTAAREIPRLRAGAERILRALARHRTTAETAIREELSRLRTAAVSTTERELPRLRAAAERARQEVSRLRVTAEMAVRRVLSWLRGAAAQNIPRLRAAVERASRGVSRAGAWAETALRRELPRLRAAVKAGLQAILRARRR